MVHNTFELSDIVEQNYRHDSRSSLLVVKLLPVVAARVFRRSISSLANSKYANYIGKYGS